MTMKFMRFKDSFRGLGCPERESEECVVCSGSDVEHVMEMVVGKEWVFGDEIRRLLSVLVAVRNIRLFVKSGLDRDLVVEKFLIDIRRDLNELQGAEQIYTNFRNLEKSCKLLFSRKRKKKPQKSRNENIIDTLIACDQMYFRIYYILSSTLPHEKVFDKTILPLLEPFRYFSKWIQCQKGAEKLVEKFTKEFCSQETQKQLFSEIYLDMDENDTSIKDNRLFRYFIIRWKETSLLAHLFEEDTVLLPNENPENTMKGTLPVSTSLRRKWIDSIRDFACHIYAYAIPTPNALKVLEKVSPLVEIGSGTGYWAKLLRNRSVEITALDRDPLGRKCDGITFNEYHGMSRAFTRIQRGDQSSLKTKYKDSSLLLCYPPPLNRMGVECVNAFRGETIVYVGEWNGDTGDEELQNTLQCLFQLEECIQLPNWDNTSYFMMIWKRKSKHVEANIYTNLGISCFTCGMSKHCKRCSLTCSISFCSEKCFQKGQSQYKFECAIRHVTPKETFPSFYQI